MKKISFLLTLAIVLAALSLSACDGLTTDYDDSGCSHSWKGSTCTEPNTCSLCGKTRGVAPGHDWKDATCTEPKTCSTCGKTSGSALGHTTTTGKCSRCYTNQSAWETGNYNDEFGQPTSKKYIISDSITGKFSNSATTNSELYACIQIDADNVAIMLWEYGNRLVKGTFDYEYYDVTVLDENGTKHYFTTTLYQSNTRLYFSDSDRTKIINLLSQNDELSFYIESTKYSISKYLFTINSSGFSEAYRGL